LPGDLRTMAVPEPAGTGDFVKNRLAAIRLGKSLFWDMQVGSDGVQACATCHFRAGADPRSKNQLNPGSMHVPALDQSFSFDTGPNYQLRATHFPFRQLSDPSDRSSAPLFDNNDVVSSQGIHYLARGPQGMFVSDPDGFRVGSSNTRRVEPRNTPSVINAVFNHRNFWDGRAESVFNGVNHVGTRDPHAKVVRALTPTRLEQVFVRLEHSSLASQAVAPIVSNFEMASPGPHAARCRPGPRAPYASYRF
jgi:cytochrome c peroxidase